MKINIKNDSKTKEVVVNQKQLSIEESEIKILCKKNNIEYLEGYENQIFEFILTDATCDSYNEVIIPKGVKFDRYKKNPVVLGFHNSHTYPVGSCLKVWYDKDLNCVKGLILLMDDRVDSTGVAGTCLNMVRSGFLKTGSIGFRPIKAHRPTIEDIALYKIDGDKSWSLVYDEIELIEFSIVPVPANPSAIMSSIQKMGESFSAIQKDFLKTYGINFDEPTIDITHNSNDRKSNTEISTENKVIAPIENKEYIKPKGNMKLKINIDPTKCNVDDLIAQLKEYRELSEKGAEVDINISTQENGSPSSNNNIIEPSSINLKAGASISKKNKEKITKAIEGCKKALETLEEILSDSNEDEPEPGSIFPDPTASSLKEASLALDSFLENLTRKEK